MKYIFNLFLGAMLILSISSYRNLNISSYKKQGISFNRIRKLPSSIIFNKTQALVFTLNLSNVKSDKAKIHIGFYTKSDNFPVEGKGSIIKVISPEKSGSISVSFSDIPPGRYALALYQDLNGDKKLNKNFIGYPKEPFGFSRNFIPKLSAPKFVDCEIVFDELHTSFSVALLK